MKRGEPWEKLEDGNVAGHSQTVLKKLAELFPSSPREHLEPLISSLQFRRYLPGAVLCSEGEPSSELYVLCKGICGVYTQESDGRLQLVQTVDQVGALIGEQSFGQDRPFRSATILALGECDVGVLASDCLEELFSADPNAGETLGRWGSWFARNQLLLLAQEIREIGNTHHKDELKVLEYPSGATLYCVGDKSDCAYFLLSGTVGLFRAGSDYSQETIRSGLVFGASDAMLALPRRETAVSISLVEVLKIDAGVLKGYLERQAGSGTILRALESAHNLPQFGTVYRSLAQVDGEPCVVSDYRLIEGARVRVRMFPSRACLEVAKQTASGQASTLVSPDGKIVWMVSESNELVGLRSPSGWDGLSEAMSMILRSGRLTDFQRRAFASTGTLLMESSSARNTTSSEIVCACTNASCAELSQAAKRVKTLDELIKLTGAGGVCGGCKGRLPVFLGKQSVYLCRLKKLPLAVGSLQVCLDSVDQEQLPMAKVGQFIRLESLIDGVWVGRPYTLTDCTENQYQIGVKIEEGGFFSNWIQQAQDGTLMRVFAPEGDVCPDPEDEQTLVYFVAGIGVTPAIAAARRLADTRSVVVHYGYRQEEGAPFLEELRQHARNARIELVEYSSSKGNRITSQDAISKVGAIGDCEVIVCGPGDFNRTVVESLRGVPGVRVRADSFAHSQRGQGKGGGPGAWRQKNFQPRCPLEEQVELKSNLSPLEQAVAFLKAFQREQADDMLIQQRIEQVAQELQEQGSWNKTPQELGFAARLAWRNASRCVGRLYWNGLHLRDCRDLQSADQIAEALFEHLRFAWNGGDLRPAISVFAPATKHSPGPRIWNPQLLRYAGVRLRSGKQIGDPAQNELTKRIMGLGWEPQGTDFELLPLVIQTADEGPKLYELPEDCRREVELSHPQHAWLSARGLKWYALPAVSDMALDAGGVLYRLAPFNGWYLDCEIAARNLTDANRYNLLPELAEWMGLDTSNDRTLWRDRAMLMLHEAVLHSYDRAGVRIADHHHVCHEFLEFCRNEQAAGREPYGRWMWLVPPFSSSATVLYQEPFRDVSIKPAYRYQKAVWE